MIRRRLILLCGLLCLVTLLGGCGKGSDLVPVTGTVTYKGQPVEGASVAFRCDEANTIATGTTDAEGRFELSTYKQGAGAVAGTHKVTVSKSADAGQPAAGGGSMEDAMSQMKAPPKASAEPKSALPEIYADPARSQLEYTVSADGTNDFKIELK